MGLKRRCIAVVLFVMGTTAAWTKPVDVRAVRVWASPDNPRVVLDLSGNAAHHLSVSHDPERVTVQLSGARLAKGVKSANGGAVKRLRITPRRNDLEVVLDL